MKQSLKRIAVLCAVLLCVTLPSHAVLKERDLGRTLGVLRGEMERNYKELKSFIMRYEKMNEDQHAQLVDYMKRSEQIALILYSQKTDFSFDVAYACQQATDLYRELHSTNRPYTQIRDRMMTEVARYDSLIVALKVLPPAIDQPAREMTAADSLLADSTLSDDEEPYMLTAAQQHDRALCIRYAMALRGNFAHFIDMLNKDFRYYQEVSERVQKLNDYAQKCYSDLRRNIFVNGEHNYIYILSHLPLYAQMVQRDFTDKYMPLNSDRGPSEWRGPLVLGVSVFMLFYIIVATLLSMLIMRGLPWLIKKAAPRLSRLIADHMQRRLISAEEYKLKRGVLTMAVGVALFAIAIMLVRQFLHHNIVIMATNLMINVAWLMEVIIVSLLIRLKGQQLRHGLSVYTPFITMAFIVIVFRIILIPNSIVNLVYPPVLLLFVMWQISSQRKNKDNLTLSDSIYASVSLLTLIIGCVLSWTGFTLLAVQVMLWWTFQLAFIQTITCCYDLLRMYEERVLIRKLQHEVGEDTAAEALVKSMRKGDHFTTTWLFDFGSKTVIPVMAVLSVLMSIYFAVDMFEMTAIVEDVFFRNFINEPGIIQVSLFKLCLVTACFYLFRYINYAIRSYYHHWNRKAHRDDENFNETLANNVIAILVWGAYCFFALILLQVPKSGISVVTAGLATGMGFAMKDLLENFFYGISLMTGRVRVGDYIECDGVQGRVESITYQSTQIYTVDGSVIAFLNSSLFRQNFKNLTRNHDYVLVKIPIGVAYGANVEEVRRILTTALKPLHNKLPDGRSLMKPGQKISVAFADFGASSVDLVVVAWVLVDQKVAYMARAREIIYTTLNDHGIEIPFPQQDIYIRQIAETPNAAAPEAEKA